MWHFAYGDLVHGRAGLWRPCGFVQLDDDVVRLYSWNGLTRTAPREVDEFAVVVAFRVVEVEGVEARERRRFIEDLTMRDTDFLVDEFDRVDCGVDTTIEIECPECFAAQDLELPFYRTFFMPGRERTARRRDRSSSFRE